MRTVNSSTYKAFLSYSHSADGALAPTLQSALQKFAKPWYRQKSMRLFCDKTGLSATPALWPEIEKALSQSEFLILLASPEAAQSAWVSSEVAWWLDHRSTSELLIVLTRGSLVWDRTLGDFDWNLTDALPPCLQGRVSSEPLFVDLRWAAGMANISSRDFRLRDAVLSLAAPLLGRPKDLVDGEDIREYRRTMRISWAAGITLAVLAGVATVFGWYAFRQAQSARKQLSEKLIEHASSALLRSDHPSAVSDALEAVETSPSHDEDFDRSVREVLLQAFFSARRTQVLGKALPDPGATMFRDGKFVALGADYRLQTYTLKEGAWIAGRAIPLEGALAWSSAEKDRYGERFSSIENIGAIAGVHEDSVYFWSVDDGSLLEAFELPNSKASNFLVSPTGRRILYQGFYGSDNFYIINVAAHSATSLILTTSLDVTEQLSGLAFSPDENRFATMYGHQIAKIWDLAQMREIATFVGHRNAQPRYGSHPSSPVAFSPDGSLLATASEDGTARIWKSQTGDPVDILAGHTDELTFVGFSPDGRLIYTTSLDAYLRLWDAKTGRQLSAFLSPEGPLQGARLDLKSRTLVTVTSEGLLRSWTLEPGQFLAKIDLVSKSRILGGTPKRIVLDDPEEGARIVSLENGAVLGALDPRPASVRFQPNGDLLITISEEGLLSGWRASSGKPFSLTEGVGLQAEAAAFSPAGDLVAISTAEGNVHLWRVSELGSGKPGRRFQRDAGDRSSGVVFSPDGQKLASWSYETQSYGAPYWVWIWEIASRRLVARVPFEDQQFESKNFFFTPDSAFLLAPVFAGVSEVSLESGKETARYETGAQSPVDRIAISPAGDLIAATGLDGSVHMFSRTGEKKDLWHYSLYSGEGFDIRFSQDGEYLLGVPNDPEEQVLLWDSRSGKVVTRLQLSDGGAEFTAEDKAGGRLVVLSRRGVTISLPFDFSLPRLMSIAQQWWPQEKKPE